MSAAVLPIMDASVPLSGDNYYHTLPPPCPPRFCRLYVLENDAEKRNCALKENFYLAAVAFRYLSGPEFQTRAGWLLKSIHRFGLSNFAWTKIVWPAMSARGRHAPPPTARAAVPIINCPRAEISFLCVLAW